MPGQAIILVNKDRPRLLRMLANPGFTFSESLALGALDSSSVLILCKLDVDATDDGESLACVLE